MLAARRVAPLLVLFITAFAFAAGPKGDDLVKAKLVSEKTHFVPGSVAKIAVVLTPEKGWHTYWKNSGDTGLAPTFRWVAPEGFTFSEARWPLPHLQVSGPLTDYVYGEETWHLFDVQVPATAKVGEDVTVTTEVKWLVCDKVCLPGKGTLSMRLPVGTDAKPGSEAKGFATAENQLPLRSTGHIATAKRENELLVLTVAAPANGRAPKGRLRFLPWNKGEFANSAPQPVEQDGNTVRLRLTVDEVREARPTRITGVLVAEEGFTAKNRQGLWIDVAVEGEASAAAATTGKIPPIWQLCLFALLGGLILNLMPCVFPVLSIKILGFVDHAQSSPTKARSHAWAFFAGVVISFWVLAGTLLLLRAGGQQLGWGFQLQSPTFVVLLALLFWVLGLYFVGVFELAGNFMALGQGLVDRGGFIGSFANGALATLAATPCTAPFMGSAVGFALLSGPWIAFLLFTMLGVGMAAPYVILTASPRLLAFLPRPGRWMESLKMALAFPLFGTTLWLAWVLGQQKGLDATVTLMIAALFLAFATWLFGRWSPTRVVAPRMAALVLAAFAAACSGYFARRAVLAEGGPGVSKELIATVPYDKARIAQLQAEGHPVFVDFSAAWCLSCQVNERLIFSSAAVLAQFEAKKVTVMKADWTNGDAKITQALAEFGRSGIPFYLFYPGKPGAAPKELPEVLTPALVLEALNSLGG